MKSLIKIVISVLLISFGGSSHAADATLSKKILGSWECSEYLLVSGVHITVESTDVYVRNGKSNYSGIMTMILPSEDLVLKLLVVGSGEWEISDGFLIATSTDHKITHLNPDPNNRLPFNIADLFPNSASDSYKITNLSKDRLTVVSETTGATHSCTPTKF